MFCFILFCLQMLLEVSLEKFVYIFVYEWALFTNASRTFFSNFGKVCLYICVYCTIMKGAAHGGPVTRFFVFFYWLRFYLIIVLAEKEPHMGDP